MVTVLIATYNGAQTLPKALKAYCQLRSPEGGWKLVLVDNGSTDATKEIVHSFMDRLPIVYVLETSQGKNFALNTGLASVEGDLIVFTDDDTLPWPDWLVEMRRAVDSQPSFSIFGGAVVPHWETAPDEWILAWVRMDQVFALTDPAWEEGPLPPYFVFGNNMAIRAEIFKRYRFNVSIGPRGRNYAMGAETELTLRLAKDGFKSWHSKKAVVEHIIRKFQISRRWILGRARRYGRGKYRLETQYDDVARESCLGVPRYLIKEIVKQSLSVGRARLRGDAADLFQRQWRFNYLLGQAIEARLIQREFRPGNRA